MTPPALPSDLPALLEVLANPDHPAFMQALAQLKDVAVADLTYPVATAWLAQLDVTLIRLQQQHTEAATLLASLRQQVAASSAYRGG